MEPILKWAGGKRQILSRLISIVSPELRERNRYFEPFVGGGSLFFSLEHAHAVINDSNKELVNVYEQVRDNPDKVIALLEEHAQCHSKDYYYAIRAWDRSSDYCEVSAVSRAARTIYLNRTCFNGLYRVNRQGCFNVPIGSYTEPQIVRESQIRKISDYLQSNDVQILCGDFEQAVSEAKAGDVVYFDPPYDYDDGIAEGFVRYTADRFSRESLVRLKAVCEKLIARGCRVIISNNDTEYVNQLFGTERFEYIRLLGRRMINNTSVKRRGVNEVIIIGRE